MERLHFLREQKQASGIKSSQVMGLVALIATSILGGGVVAQYNVRKQFTTDFQMDPTSLVQTLSVKQLEALQSIVITELARQNPPGVKNEVLVAK